MSSRMRVTKGHSNNRRAHHGIKASRLSKCSNCQAFHERHKLCLECGFYRGKEILNIKKAENLVKTSVDTKDEKIESENKKNN